MVGLVHGTAGLQQSSHLAAAKVNTVAEAQSFNSIIRQKGVKAPACVSLYITNRISRGCFCELAALWDKVKPERLNRRLADSFQLVSEQKWITHLGLTWDCFCIVPFVGCIYIGCRTG